MGGFGSRCEAIRFGEGSGILGGSVAAFRGGWVGLCRCRALPWFERALTFRLPFDLCRGSSSYELVVWAFFHSCDYGSVSVSRYESVALLTLRYLIYYCCFFSVSVFAKLDRPVVIAKSLVVLCDSSVYGNSINLELRHFQSINLIWQRHCCLLIHTYPSRTLYFGRRFCVWVRPTDSADSDPFCDIIVYQPI
jgi:hypothetical protein